MKIKLTSVHVDDQEKALRFYTEVLGFVKKTDVSAGRVPLADGGLARGAGRRRTTSGAQRQPGREDLPAGAVRAEYAGGDVLHRRRPGRLRAHQGPRG